MALRLILGAVAHHRHVARGGETLQQAQREFLPVVLDGAAARVDPSAHEQLLPVGASELCPGESSRLEGPQEPLAWPKRRHPYIVATQPHPPSTEPSDEDSQSVVLRGIGTVDRLCLEHLIRIVPSSNAWRFASPPLVRASPPPSLRVTFSIVQVTNQRRSFADLVLASCLLAVVS